MRTSRLVRGILALGLVVAATACGSDDEDDGGASDTVGSSDEPDAESTTIDEGTSAPTPDGVDGSGDEQIDPEGVLRVATFMDRLGMEIEPEPGNIYGTGATHLGILTYTIGTPLVLGRDGSFEPFLAQSYEVVDDTTFRLTMREGLTFHDGTPYTAQVLADTMLDYQQMETTAFGGTVLAEIESIDVVDETELLFNLASPVAGLMPNTLANLAGLVISPSSDPPNTVYGAGPFEIVAFERDDHLTVEKFDEYWNADNILLGGIEFINIPAIEAAQNALESGQVDLVATNPRDADALLARGSFESVVTQNQGHYMLPICNGSPPFDDPQFREAFNLAMNREQINEVALGGNAEALQSMWNADSPLAVEGLIDPDGDPEKAQALLDEIGWDPDATIPFGVFPGFQTQQLVAETIAGQVADVGINLDIVVYEGYDIPRFVNPDTGGLHVLVNYFPDVQAATTPASAASAYYSPCGYEDPNVAELAAPIVAGTLGSDELIAAWTELQEYIIGENLWYPLVTQPAVYAYNSDRVSGLQPGTVGLAGATAPSPFYEGVAIVAE